MNIVITGVSRGIGKSTLKCFYEQGYNCIGLTRSAITDSSSNIGTLIQINWNEIHGIESALKTALNGGKIDILINNAASIDIAPLDELTEDQFLEQFTTNTLSPFQLTRYLMKSNLLQQGAHVVNIGSMAGFQGASKFPGLGAYSVSKAGLAAITECMATEWSSQINVNCLCLGAVNTEMLNQAFPDYVSEINDVQMGSFICEFAKNSGQIVNGQVIPIKKSDPN